VLFFFRNELYTSGFDISDLSDIYSLDLDLGSVVDRHPFDADPDADPDPDWRQTMPILVRFLPRFYTCWKIRFYFYGHSIASGLSFSSVSNVLYSLIIWTVKKMKLSGKFAYKLFHLLRIDTDPDPAKLCGSDPIRIHNTP
jgi:hypothetical protein